MLGVGYTSHTEKEFITHKQFMLNLKMYTAEAWTEKAWTETPSLNGAVVNLRLCFD